MKTKFYIYQNGQLQQYNSQTTAQSVYALNANSTLIEDTGETILAFNRRFDGPKVCQDVQEAVYLSTLTKE